MTSSAEGFASAEGNGYLVALDTALSDSLIIEGLAREIVRTVQDARKSAGLEISDRIHLSVEGSDNVLQAVANHRDYLLSETLTAELQPKEALMDGFEASRSTENEHWTITLIRA